jgi:integrase
MLLGEAKRVLEASFRHGTMTYARWTVALRWGPRQGEVPGLRWCDVDLQTGHVSIRQSLRRQKGKGLVFVTPRSRAGRRSFFIDLDGLRTLAAWRKALT